MTTSQENWQQAYATFFSNISRVHRLIDACRSHTTIGKGGQQELDQAGDDIARCAVVFLHAAFEVFIRHISSKKKGTFSNLKEIENVLNKLGVDYSNQAGYLSSIEVMIKRRHKIVHTGDVSTGSSEPDRLSLEESVSITRWFLDVDFFVSEMVLHYVSPEYAKYVDEQLQSRKANRKQFEECNRDA